MSLPVVSAGCSEGRVGIHMFRQCRKAGELVVTLPADEGQLAVAGRHRLLGHRIISHWFIGRRLSGHRIIGHRIIDHRLISQQLHMRQGVFLTGQNYILSTALW